MSMFRIALAGLLAFSASAPQAISQSANAPSPQSAEATSSPERVAADTSRVTPGGATFTIPAGWSIVSGKNLVILSPPEPDTHIAIFDSEAPNDGGLSITFHRVPYDVTTAQGRILMAGLPERLAARLREGR